jgi:hypothetical protein
MSFHYKQTIIPAVIAVFILFLGFSADPPDGNTGAPFDGLCTNCHSGGSFDGTVSISGFPSSITPNTTYDITLTTTATMGSPLVGGFQLVAVNASNVNSGNLTAGTGNGTSFFNSREYVDHRGAKSFSGGTVSWNFTWTSPNGPNGAVITMYFSSNLANGNGSSSGDKIINDSQSGTMVGGGVPLTVNVISKKNVSCFGGNDGEATASAGGGDPPYSYSWSNGDMINKATLLSAGTYKVTATDNSGSTATASVFITQPTALTHELKVTKNVTCPGGKDGSILATANGGTSPYNFIYSSGSPNNLIAGVYSVTVSDANSCTVSSSVVVTEPDSFSIIPIILQNPACPLDSNGQIRIAVTGANSPYKYLWSSGETSNQIINKKVGNYKVTITDIKNCNTVRGYELKTIDDMAPILVGKNGKVYLNSNGFANVKISDFIQTHTDNCDPAPLLTISKSTFTCDDIPKRNCILTSTDASNNISKDTIEIEIVDTIKPNIQLWNDTLIKRCDVIVPSLTATDNCAITEFKKINGPDPGTVFPIGETTIVYSAKDASNNVTIDSFKVTIQSPLHFTMDSFYFNYCTGDTAFTILSVNHDLDLPVYFYYLMDTTKILNDSTFTIATTTVDTVKFRIDEESGCLLSYEHGFDYPGLALTLDSFRLTHQVDIQNPDGKIEVFIFGADSIAWYDANTDTLVNNSGLNLAAGKYIVKAYKGTCEFDYGPYEIKLILSTDHSESINLKAFPIPFSNEINVTTEFKSELQYTLLNSQGFEITKGKFNSNLILGTSNLNAGMYYLKCFGTKKSQVIKLLKL